jgi:tetratricopeptide (TPR) repeat protein
MIRSSRFRSLSLRCAAALVLLLPSLLRAQEADPSDQEYLRYLDLGVRQLEAGRYQDADQSFRTVLDNVKVLPAEICHYFGVNSYHLKKYKQSINWLTKYIELKGTSGQFYESTADYLKLAEEAYLQATARPAPAENDLEEPDPGRFDTDIDCGPSGMVVCPVCRGRRVIVREGYFGREFQSCPYCNEHGQLTCEEYNLLLKGQLQPRDERVSP